MSRKLKRKIEKGKLMRLSRCDRGGKADVGACLPSCAMPPTAGPIRADRLADEVSRLIELHRRASCG